MVRKALTPVVSCNWCTHQEKKSIMEDAVCDHPDCKGMDMHTPMFGIPDWCPLEEYPEDDNE